MTYCLYVPHVMRFIFRIDSIIVPVNWDLEQTHSFSRNLVSPNRTPGIIRIEVLFEMSFRFLLIDSELRREPYKFFACAVSSTFSRDEVVEI